MIFRQFFFIVMAALLSFGPAHAEKRIALLIGNGHYANLDSTQQLATSRNDVEAVGKALDRLGFETQRATDLGVDAMRKAVDDFAARIAEGDLILFFFTGFGFEVAGQGLLVPSDVPAPGRVGEREVLSATVPVGNVIDALSARKPRAVILILDISRDNPFGPSADTGRGLAPASPASDGANVFVLYSTGASQTALDRLNAGDRDPHSVFTRVLLQHIETPGIDLSQLATRVRRGVVELAMRVSHTQTPAYYDSLVESVVLAGPR